jgi:hypothetical protein
MMESRRRDMRVGPRIAHPAPEPQRTQRRLLEPSVQLHVIKCIALREGYLSRLESMAEYLQSSSSPALKRKGEGSSASRLGTSGSWSLPVTTLPAGMVDLLEVLRMASLDVVEAVMQWRLALDPPAPDEPYLWNGVNYLVKMGTDTDFLEGVSALRAWFGFSLLHNPFLLPHPADQEEGSNVADRVEIGEQTDENGKTFGIWNAKSGSVELGRQPWERPAEVPLPPVIERPSRLRKRNSPYDAPVVNDPYLLPIKAVNCSHVAWGLAPPVSRPSTAPLLGNHLSPSIIKGADLSRITLAESIIAHEESRSSNTPPSPVSVSGLFERVAKMHGDRPASADAAVSAVAVHLLPKDSSSLAALLQQDTAPASGVSLKKIGAPFHEFSAAASMGHKRIPRRRPHSARLGRKLAQLQMKIEKNCANSSMFDIRELEQLRYEQHVWSKVSSGEGGLITLKRARREAGQVLEEDEEVAHLLEEASAKCVQRHFRGTIGRHTFCEIFREKSAAAVIIQKHWRGTLTWRLMSRRSRLDRAATVINKVLRGLAVRRVYVTRREAERRRRASSLLQRVARGALGRRRAHACRNMMSNVRAAQSAAAGLKEVDLLSLAETIRSAITTVWVPFPPLAVLGLMRCVLAALGEAPEILRIHSAFGQDIVEHVTPDTLTWERAMRILRRPVRLQRRMCGRAGGREYPGPLHLPRNCVTLTEQYMSGTEWTDDALLTDLRGGAASSRAVIALREWITGLVAAERWQGHLLDFLLDSQPSWLRKSRCLQRQRRKLELELREARAAQLVAEAEMGDKRSRGEAFPAAAQAYEELTRRLDAVAGASLALQDRNMSFEAALRSRFAIQTDSLQAMERDAERDMQVAARELDMARKLHRAEDHSMLESQFRDREREWRSAQRAASNWISGPIREIEHHLSNWVPPTEACAAAVTVVGQGAGSLCLLEMERKETLRRGGGVKYIGSIRMDNALMSDIYERMEAVREDLRTGRARVHQAVSDFETALRKDYYATAEAETREVASWDNSSDLSAQQEKLEALDASAEEVALMTDGVTDRELEECFAKDADQKIPALLIIISLDVPTHSRAQIRSRLDALLPQSFEHLSARCGEVCYVLRAIGAGRHVTVEVDTGLTLSGRQIFLHWLQIVLACARPPDGSVRLAVVTGAPGNRNGSGAEIHLGVSGESLSSMNCGGFKGHLQEASSELRSLDTLLAPVIEGSDEPLRPLKEPARAGSLCNALSAAQLLFPSDWSEMTRSELLQALQSILNLRSASVETIKALGALLEHAEGTKWFSDDYILGTIGRLLWHASQAVVAAARHGGAAEALRSTVLQDMSPQALVLAVVDDDFELHSCSSGPNEVLLCTVQSLIPSLLSRMVNSMPLAAERRSAGIAGDREAERVWHLGATFVTESHVLLSAVPLGDDSKLQMISVASAHVSNLVSPNWMQLNDVGRSDSLSSCAKSRKSICDKLLGLLSLDTSGSLQCCHPMVEVLRTQCSAKGSTFPVAIFESSRATFVCQATIHPSEPTLRLEVSSNTLAEVLGEDFQYLMKKSLLLPEDVRNFALLLADRLRFSDSQGGLHLSLRRNGQGRALYCRAIKIIKRCPRRALLCRRILTITEQIHDRTVHLTMYDPVSSRSSKVAILNPQIVHGCDSWSLTDWVTQLLWRVHLHSDESARDEVCVRDDSQCLMSAALSSNVKLKCEEENGDTQHPFVMRAAFDPIRSKLEISLIDLQRRSVYSLATDSDQGGTLDLDQLCELVKVRVCLNGNFRIISRGLNEEESPPQEIFPRLLVSSTISCVHHVNERECSEESQSELEGTHAEDGHDIHQLMGCDSSTPDSLLLDARLVMNEPLELESGGTVLVQVMEVFSLGLCTKVCREWHVIAREGEGESAHIVLPDSQAVRSKLAREALCKELVLSETGLGLFSLTN